MDDALPSRAKMISKNSKRNIFGGKMTTLPFSESPTNPTLNQPLLREYADHLAKKAEGTIEAYLRTVCQVMIWVAHRPGNGATFQPHQLTKTAVEMYMVVPFVKTVFEQE